MTSDDLFREGGEFNIRKLGDEQYEMQVPIPTDEAGLIARECTRPECSPGYFKIKGGTGLPGPMAESYCPYCRVAAEPSKFATAAQWAYVLDQGKNEAKKGLDRVIRDTLGFKGSNRRNLVDGLIKIDITYDPPRTGIVAKPIEDELQRDIVCPRCTLVHAVYGLATWCPDCGSDIAAEHIRLELHHLALILADVPNRRAKLGARAARRDIENALEDCVSVFEAAVKYFLRRHLSEKGTPDSEIETILGRKIRNGFQDLARAPELFLEYCGIPLFEALTSDQLAELTRLVGMRHPITHNLGVVDRKYLERTAASERIGRELRISEAEVGLAIHLVERMLIDIHGRLFVRD